MTFDIHQSWMDSRFKNTSRNPNDYNLYKAEEFENIWRPDTYIANEMPNGVFETTPTDNIYAYFNGSLFLTTRLVYEYRFLFFPLHQDRYYFLNEMIIHKLYDIFFHHVVGLISKNLVSYVGHFEHFAIIYYDFYLHNFHIHRVCRRLFLLSVW